MPGMSQNYLKKLINKHTGKPLMKPTRRQPKGMNLTEKAYSEHLERMKLAGEILDYGYEKLKFRLAKKTWYTPDFFVLYPIHMEIHEVKGYWKDDARVKFKVAAELFPWAIWKAVTLEDGQWIYEEDS
nr:hypothetical protein 11 [Dehalococcoidia bacterium]